MVRLHHQLPHQVLLCGTQPPIHGLNLEHLLDLVFLFLPVALRFDFVLGQLLSLGQVIVLLVLPDHTHPPTEHPAPPLHVAHPVEVLTQAFSLQEL